ncbi:MAG TPA: hypothetical protein VHI54_01265 [Actinomycetota bacterium]|nr:hypothetical protein [Actinomycetota bacterium]
MKVPRWGRSSPLKWVAVVTAATVCLSIGPPLIGLGTFFPADLLYAEPPWSQDAPPGFKRTNPILEDPVNAGMPNRAEYRRGVRRGDFPLWNRYPSGGIPLAAVPTNGSLSLFNTLYVALPLWYAPAAAKLLEMAIAILFMFLLLTSLGFGRVPALVGGLIYVNSGFQVVWTNWPHSHIGALTPALLWATERVVQRRTLRSALPVTAIVCAMLLEGFPPVTTYALMLSTAYFLFRVFARPASFRERLQVAGVFGTSVLLAAGLVALQLLPWFQQLGTLDLTYREQAAQSHLPLGALLTMAIPNFFGSPTDANYFGSMQFERTSYVVLNYQELQSFIGITALILIAVWIASRTRGPEDRLDSRAEGLFPFLVIGAAVTILLIYVGGPALSLLQAVPVFRLNFIGRLRSMLGVILSILAAAGLHRLLTTDVLIWKRRWSSALPIIGVGAIFMLAAVQAWSLVSEVHQRRYVARQSVIPLLTGAVVVGAVALRRRVKVWGNPLFAWIVPLAIAAESLAFVLPFWPRVSKDFFYPPTPAHEFLQDNLGRDRLALGGKAMYPGTTTFYSLRAFTSHSFVGRAWKDLIEAADPTAFRPTGPTYPILRTSQDLVTSPVLDRASVRYFVNPPEAPVLGRRIPAPSGTRSAVLPPGERVVTRVRDGSSIRAVAVHILRGLRDRDRNAVLHAELLRRSGEVIGRGDRPVGSERVGRFEIPVVLADESQPVRGSHRIRLSLTGTSEALLIRGDDAGRPAVSVVLARPDRLQLVFDRGVVIYRRLDALPRIRWAGRSIPITDPSRRVTALAEGLPGDAVVLSRPGPEPSGKTARIRTLSDAADEIRVEIVAEGAGYLVVADAIQYGWTASIDGRPQDVVPADHAMGAVFVPAGRHEVTLRFEPASWRRGVVISAISAGICVLIAVRRPRPRKPEVTEPAG